MMEQRKFKSLVTLYHDYDSDYVEQHKPEDLKHGYNYCFARKGSVFTLGKLFERPALINKKLYILLEHENEVNILIERGWFIEV